MEDKFKLLISELGEIRIKRNIPLADYTKYKIDGIIPALYIATSTRELIRIIDLCRELNIQFLLLGTGSKILEKDVTGIDLVIKNRSDNIKIFGIKGKISKNGLGIEEAFIEADSGVGLDRLYQYCESQGLSGLELLEDKFGTVGGSLLTTDILKGNIYQIKILNNLGKTIDTDLSGYVNDSIILSITFKLKSNRH